MVDGEEADVGEACALLSGIGAMQPPQAIAQRAATAPLDDAPPTIPQADGSVDEKGVPGVAPARALQPRQERVLAVRDTFAQRESLLPLVRELVRGDLEISLVADVLIGLGIDGAWAREHPIRLRELVHGALDLMDPNDGSQNGSGTGEWTRDNDATESGAGEEPPGCLGGPWPRPHLPRVRSCSSAGLVGSVATGTPHEGDNEDAAGLESSRVLSAARSHDLPPVPGPPPWIGHGHTPPPPPHEIKVSAGAGKEASPARTGGCF